MKDLKCKCGNSSVISHYNYNISDNRCHKCRRIDEQKQHQVLISKTPPRSDKTAKDYDR